MMIWLPPEYGHGPIDLLHEEKPDHLVGEGHFREGDLLIGSLINLFRKTEWTPDNKDTSFLSGGHDFFNPGGKFHRTELLSSLIENYDMV